MTPHLLLVSARNAALFIALNLVPALIAQPSGFPLDNSQAKVLVDSLSAQLKRYYVNTQAAEKMTAVIQEKQRSGVYEKITDPHELAAALTKDVLSGHHDEHFHVEYNPSMLNELTGNIDDVPKLVAERLKQDQIRNFGFRKAEILPGNIGYLEISGFSRLNSYSRAAADATMKFLSNSSALIIDLRYGIGGSPDMLTYLAGFFFAKRTHVSDIYIRSENAKLPYYTKPDSTSGRLTTMPVFILTSYKTFSAAEGFAYALQKAGRARIVGEVTRGGAHTVTYRALSSGFIADIPFGEVIDPVTGTNWEGTGVHPDVTADAEASLEIAEKKIIEEGEKSAKDSVSRRYYRWNAQMLQSINHPLTLDSASAARYTGEYGPFTVSYSKGTLYYQKTGKARFPLIVIDNVYMRPRGTESFMLQFGQNKDRMTLLTTHYDDGRSECGTRR